MSEKKENKKEETKAPVASGKKVKRAFQFQGKKFLVGDTAPKVIADKKELQGFF